MTRTAYHRPRRGMRQDSPFIRFLKGLGAGIAATAAFILIFALIVGMTDAADGVIRVVNQLIKLTAILLGVHIAVEKGSGRGALTGGLLGLAYMGAGVLVYALFTRQQLSFTAYLMDMLMGISVGGLYGMLRSRCAPCAN